MSKLGSSGVCTWSAGRGPSGQSSRRTRRARQRRNSSASLTSRTSAVAWKSNAAAWRPSGSRSFFATTGCGRRSRSCSSARLSPSVDANSWRNIDRSITTRLMGVRSVLIASLRLSESGKKRWKPSAVARKKRPLPSCAPDSSRRRSSADGKRRQRRRPPPSCAPVLERQRSSGEPSRRRPIASSWSARPPPSSAARRKRPRREPRGSGARWHNSVGERRKRLWRAFRLRRRPQPSCVPVPEP
mmetsp:Transcript_122880/g.352906  ORF Transcript_122880/g.352906 Transcript_122880/m.352906 type:complete len:243 (+) Transcript_122880:1574-2302(+)